MIIKTAKRLILKIKTWFNPRIRSPIVDGIEGRRGVLQKILNSVSGWSNATLDYGTIVLPCRLLEIQNTLDLSCTNMIVLLHLLKSGPGGPIKPDIKEIAAQTGCAPITVRRSLAKLKALDIIDNVRNLCAK